MMGNYCREDISKTFLKIWRNGKKNRICYIGIQHSYNRSLINPEQRKVYDIRTQQPKPQLNIIWSPRPTYVQVSAQFPSVPLRTQNLLNTITHTMVRELFHYLTQVSAPSIYFYSARMEAWRQQKAAARKWLISNDENTTGTPI